MRYLFKLPLIAGLYVVSLHSSELPSPPQDVVHQVPIDPKARAKDYVEAFNFLRKEKTAIKVAFILKDNSSISNIIDINIMEQGSMLLIRHNTSQGIKFRVVALEDIAKLEHQ